MKYLLLFLLFTCADVYAIRWPSVSDVQIASCSGGVACASLVMHSHAGTVFLDQPELVPVPNAKTKTITAYGIHCSMGSTIPGFVRPFTDCSWVFSNMVSDAHAPRVYDCLLVSTNSWELTASSTCRTDLTWGQHTGAGPGGDCVMFGILYGELLYTPKGIFDALTVANSGNSFCQKPLPPATKCDLQLFDTVLNHSTMPQTGVSTANIAGIVDCGLSPVFEFIGGGDIKIAPGVDAALKFSFDKATSQINIQSRVTTENAQGGEYSSSKVIVVSPW